MTTLPEPGQRWVSRRKEELVRGIEAGAITEAEALKRYGLSLEELNEWRARLAWDGRRALRALYRHRERLP